MSRLYKRGNRYHYRRGYLRFSLFTENKRRAEEIQRELDKRYELERFGIHTPSDLTVLKLKNEWLQFIKHDKSDSWWKSNNQKIDIFIQEFGNRPVSSLQTKDMNQYIGSIKTSKFKIRAPNTIINYIKPIRQMLKYAVSCGYIERNPLNMALLPKAKEKRRFQAISKDVLLKIFSDKNIKLKHRQFWMICYYTGLDSSDAGTLTKNQVKDNIITTKRGKSDVPVQVPLHSKLAKFNFYNIMPDANKRIVSSKLLKSALEQYDISGSVKNLRASFISRLHDLGLGMQDIKVAVGHTSARMTAHYTTKELETVRKNIEKI